MMMKNRDNHTIVAFLLRNAATFSIIRFGKPIDILIICFVFIVNANYTENSCFFKRKQHLRLHLGLKSWSSNR